MHENNKEKKKHQSMHENNKEKKRNITLPFEVDDLVCWGTTHQLFAPDLL